MSATRIPQAVVVVRRKRVRGETIYSGVVRLEGRKVWRVTEAPSAQEVCLEILDWGNRHGKTLDWHYENLTL